MSQEERLLILRMVQEGKVTAAEGAELLRALGSARTAAPPAPPVPPRPPVHPVPKAAPDSPDSPGTPPEQPMPGASTSRAVSDAFESGRSALNDIFSNFDFSSLGGLFGWGDVFKFEETYEGQFDASAAEIVVDLHSTNGRIDLVAWDRPGYRVVLTRKVRGRDEEHARERSRQLGKFTAGPASLGLESQRVNVGDGGVSVEAYLPRSLKYRVLTKTANGRVQVRGLQCTRCEVKTANGRITLEQVEAEEIEARTANGRVEVASVAPNVTCRTANGAIELNASGGIARDAFHGRYDLSTSNGSVHVRLPNHGVASAVEARTTFGSIHVELTDFAFETKEKEVGRRYVKGKTNGYDQAARAIDLSATTTNGSITVGR